MTVKALADVSRLRPAESLSSSLYFASPDESRAEVIKTRRVPNDLKESVLQEGCILDDLFYLQGFHVQP